MIKVLEKLFSEILRETVKKPERSGQLKRPSGAGDYRAVEIVPSLVACEAAKRASGKRHLCGKAPRMPLMGCTMPLSCSCMYRKKADRRDGDRRLLGAATSRWFAGVDCRKQEGRRSAVGRTVIGGRWGLWGE